MANAMPRFQLHSRSGQRLLDVQPYTFALTAALVLAFVAGGLVAAVETNVSTALSEFLRLFSWATAVSILALIMVVVFFVTSSDSGSLVIDIITSGGLVEAINFRTLVLRDLARTVHIFPNGTITTLSNMTRDWSAYVFDIGVAYGEDADQAMAVIQRVGEEIAADDYFGPLIKEPLEMFGVDQLGDSAVVIKGRIKTWPVYQWEVGRELLRRVKRAFDAEGIEIPFPQRTFHLRQEGSPLERALQEQTNATP